MKSARRALLVVAMAALGPACYHDTYDDDSPAYYKPGAFSLTAPANAAVGVSTSPAFSWTVSPRAATYTFQLATDVAFTVLLIDQAGIVTTGFVPADSLTEGTTYFWRVTAVNPYGTKPAAGAPFSFTTTTPAAVAPGAFTMVAPADTATGQSTTPKYTWTASSDAASYTLQVATDSGMTALVVNQSGINLTSATPAVTLATGVVHYWRVIAVNGTGNTTATGAPFSFTTSGPPPGPFNLTSPTPPFQTGVSKTPTYVWTASANATTYTLEVATDAGFTSLVVNQAGIATTSYTPAGSLGGLTYYYYRVTAVNVVGSTVSTPASSYFYTVP